MLRLPAFELAEPESVEEACRLLHEHEGVARPLAGGTDLLPNLKHEVVEASLVVGLWRIKAMHGIHEDGDVLRIGALTPLHEVARHPLVQAHFPSLVDAVSQIAGPQLRRMGTIGGNVCLDTRCVYINQTYFWRQALGFCLKKDGSVCHVVKNGRRCVAAASNDSAPVLMTLGATLTLQSPEGVRTSSLTDFYVPNGSCNQNRAPAELLTEITIAKPKGRTLSAYSKLRTRAAIDFPELGVAVLARLNEDETVAHADVCVTALAARPVRVKLDPALYQGRPLDKEVIDALAAEAFRRCKPLTNIATDPAYRREMVPVFVRRAFRAAQARG